MKKTLKNKSFQFILTTLLLGFFTTQIAQAQNTVTAASSAPKVCINTLLTNITHTTTGATGIGAATNLPQGVTASWSSNTITISGTPTASGVFNYSIPLTGGSGSVNATGTITVSPSSVVSTFTGDTAVCSGSPAQFTSGATSACSSLTQSLNSAGTGNATASLVSNATDNITAEGWVKLTAKPSSGVHFLFNNGNTAANGYGISINSSGQLQIFLGGKGWYNPNVSLILIPGIWQHVAIVRNAGTWFFYLNGVQYATNSTMAPNTPNSGTYIGNNNSSGEIFNGKISQVAFWNSARTTEQIQADMQSCNISGPGLAAYWSLNGTASDLSGNGKNLSLSGRTYSTDAPTIQTGAQYVYNFGDGSSETSNTGEASHIYTTSTPSTYTVSLAVTNACSTTSSSQSITVNPTPTASISGPSDACGSATLTASGGTSYSWTYGTPNNTATTTISTTSNTTVTVSNNFGCSATASKSVNITPNTVAGTISANQTINFGSVGTGIITVPGESNTNYNYYVELNSSSIASQSFSPIVDATLSQISIYVDYVMMDGDVTLEILSGSGNGGAVLSTQTVNINSRGLKTITLPTPLSITNGNTYTMKLSGNSVYLYFGNDYNDPYANGMLFVNGSSRSNEDLYFELGYNVPNANWNNLTLTGKTGNVLYWQQSSDSTFTNPTIINNTSTTLQSYSIGDLSATTYFRAVVQSGSCDILNTNKVKITVLPNNWIGATSNSWKVASNWSSGIVPGGNGDITISSGTPILDTNLTIQSGKTLTLSGTGSLTINPLKTLSIASGGTADFGGNLVTLKSDATGTAAIGTIAGTLSNATNVTVERFIPRRRAYRFLASPVTTSNFISGNWQQSTHITGSTTGQNGFDPSNSGNASLFTYNASSEAWSAIPNTNATNLNIGTGYRMIIRGNRSIDINTTTAPDSTALVLSATGSIVTGNVVFGAGSVSSSPAGIPSLNAAIGSGANSSTIGWSLIGNPYASAVNWSEVTKSNVSNTFATWNVNNAGRGSYVYHNGSAGTGNGASNIINSGQSVFVQTIGANPSLIFTEASKVSSTPPSHFKKSMSDVLNIDIFIGDRAYDGLAVLFDKSCNNEYDVQDFIKLVNPEINFYSYLADGTKLAMNNMKEIGTETIVPLGLNGVFNGGSYEMKFSNQNTFANADVKLKDKFINKMYDLKSINNLTFTVTSDSNSFGENRFELIFSKTATGLSNELTSNNNFIVFPNPASNVLNVSLTTSKEDNYSYTIFNQLGAEVSSGQLDFNNKRTHALNIEDLSAGVYFIQVKNGKTAQTIKFIK